MMCTYAHGTYWWKLFTPDIETHAHLDRVLLPSVGHVAVLRRRDCDVSRAVAIVNSGGSSQHELGGAVGVGLVVRVHDSHLVPGRGGTVHRLRHDNVEVACRVGAAAVSVLAEGGHPLAAVAL